MKKNGAEMIHLATGFVVGYPPCPYKGMSKKAPTFREEMNCENVYI